MNRRMVFVVAVGLLLAAGYAAAQASVTVSVVAVKGEKRGADEMVLGSGLESVREYLQGLPFNYYSLVKRSTMRAGYGQEARLQLNNRYTLLVKPVRKSPDGRIQVESRIMMRSESKPDQTVKALEAKGMVAREKPLRMGGLRIDGGQLVVLIQATD